MSKKVTPYRDSSLSKKEQVTLMFDRIAAKYNGLNRVLSLGLDKGWRRKLVKMVQKQGAVDVLDVATGTGDVAIALSKLPQLKLSDRITLKVADAENLPFESQFDAVTVAFGVRNFAQLEKGLSEMHRVLRNGGCLYILETSRPKAFPMRQAHYIMSRILIPAMGKLVADDKGAYAYLGESVAHFPDGKAMCNKLGDVGFSKVDHRPLSGGVVSLYVAQK
jgi:demethylmenaquinone methyltransferase/2-methoxy-6-polyprenyl-1,4-benzoquinol methylase